MNKNTTIILILLHLTLIANSEVTLYQKQFRMTDPEAANFMLQAEYPKECNSMNICAGYATIKSKKANLINFINAYIFNEEEKTCKVGTVPNTDILRKEANQPLTGNYIFVIQYYL